MVAMLLKYLLYGALPGYLVMLVLRPRSRSIQLSEIVLWSALSHPIVALIVLYVKMLGGSMDLAANFFVALFLPLAGAFLFILFSRRKQGEQIKEFQWDILITLVFILLLFVPMLGIRNWFAYHGFWHSGIVNSILAGQFPPENPGFGGEEISYVWLYHVWVAFISARTSLPPVLINLIAHLHLLVSLLGLSIVIAREWGYKGKERTWAFWFLLGSINIGALVHLAPYLIYWIISPLGLEHSYLDHLSRNVHPLLSLTGTFLKVPVFYKCWSFLIKFFNFNAMAHGVVFFYTFAWSLYRISSPRRDLSDWILYAISLLGLLLFYPVFALFAILFVVLYLGILMYRLPNLISPILVRFVLVSSTIGALCLPYFLIIGTRTGTTQVPVFSLSFDMSYLWVYGAGPFWPLLPLVFYWALKILPRERHCPKIAFLGSGILTSILAPCFIFISGGPSNYKYVYLSALFITWTSFAVLMSKMRQMPWVSVLYKGLAAGPILLTVLAWSLGPWFSDDTLALSGWDVKANAQEDGLEALEWISNHTERDGLLLIPFTKEDSKASTTYSISALTGRSMYVAHDLTWVGGLVGYANRKALAEYIWGTAALGTFAIEPDRAIEDRPMYLVYSDDVDLTTEFYTRLMAPIKKLAFYPESKMKERVESLGLAARHVYNKNRFKVLEITR